MNKEELRKYHGAVERAVNELDSLVVKANDDELFDIVTAAADASNAMQTLVVTIGANL